MFLGSYRHQVDGKGRVAIPANFRKGLAPGSVIAKGLESRLVIRPPEEWAAVERHHRLTAQSTAEERLFLRRLYASAREVELDAQGRLLLDPEHRRWTQIDGRVMVVGVGNCVELVSEEAWDREEESLDAEAFTALADRVNRPGQGPDVLSD